MKKKTPLKILAIALSLCSLVACGKNSPQLKDKDKTFITAKKDATPDTYQQIFDKLYKKEGVKVAVDELLYRIAKQVLSTSTNWTSEEITQSINERIVDHFDTYYSNEYRENGLFREEKLINSLTKSGYVISKKEAEPFVETIDNYVGYNHLKEKLTYDYSKFEEKLTKDYYIELLNEEYILTQRAANSSFYFTNRNVRKVQYFSWTPTNSSERIRYADIFQNYIDAGIVAEKDFESLATGAGGLEEQWKTKQLKDLAEDFAVINAYAADFFGTGAKAVNENAEYPLPAAYSATIIAYEKSAEVAAHETKGFRNVYAPNTYNESQKEEVKNKMLSYSNSGAHSIYEGYYQKQLEIINNKLFKKTIGSSDSSTIISSTINDAIIDVSPLYKNTNYIDITESGTMILKSESNNYVITVEKIDDDSDAAEKKIAVKELAKASSNVKNCVYFYLTSLSESGQFEVNNEDVYNYLNKTYGYGENN